MNQTEVAANAAAPLSKSDATSEVAFRGERRLRVAVASSDGAYVDRHFGQADDLWIFDVSASTHNLIEVCNIDANALGDEDRRETIYRLVADCKVLLIAKIGVTPLAKLTMFGVKGIDKYANEFVDTALRLVYQDLIQKN
jgi:lactoylglutathione lyase